MKRIILGLLISLIAAVTLAQGSGTPRVLRVITDATDALFVTNVAQTNPLSQPTVFNNTRVRTDATGALVVTGAGGGGSPTDATYITQTTNATLTNEQALASLATGIMKSTTTTGVVSSIPTSGNAYDFFLGNETFGRTVARGSIATSSPWSFTQTWNGAAQIFIGLVIDITDTLSSGTSRAFQITKAGVEQAYITSSGLVVGQSGAFTTLQSTTNQILNGGTIQFSNGVNFSAGFARTSTGIKTGNSSTGYVQHEAQDYQLVPNGTARPACAVGIRGTIWYESSGAGVPDTIAICAKDTTDTYAWNVLAIIP